MPKKSKRKGKKGKKGKKKVHPDPPPYYPVTLPSPYLFGQIVGKSVQEKDVSEAKAQALVDDANAKTYVIHFFVYSLFVKKFLKKFLNQNWLV